MNTMKKKAGVLMMGLMFLAGPARADDLADLTREVRQLKATLESVPEMKARMAELEAKLAQYERDTASAHAGHAHAGSAVNPEWLPFTHDHGHLDIHRLTIHGGMDLQFVDAEKADSDLILKEVEIALEANLTDTFTGFVSFTKEDGEEAAVEEAFGELLFEEWRLLAKAGKYFVPFGTANQAEFFDRRVITRSPMEEDLFGEEPWIDTGATLSWLLPRMAQNWSSLLTVGLFTGANEGSFLDEADSNNDYPVVARFQKRYEEGDVSFFGGLSFAHGNNDEDEKLETTLSGADAGLTIGNWDVQGEFIHRRKEETGNTLTGHAYDISTSWTWPLEMKYLDSVELLLAWGRSDVNEATETERLAPQLTLGLNPYAKFRLMYENLKEDPVDTDNDKVIGQFTFLF